MALAGVAGVGLMAALPAQALPTEIQVSFEAEANVYVNYNAGVLTSITPLGGGNLYVPVGDETLGAGQLQGSTAVNFGDNITGAGVGLVTVGDQFGGSVTLGYSFTPAYISPVGAIYTGTFNVVGSFIPLGGLETDLSSLVADNHGTISLTWTESTPQNLNNASIPSVIVSLDAKPSVPDGGLTVALLGFAFVGVEGLRRKLAK